MKWMSVNELESYLSMKNLHSRNTKKCPNPPNKKYGAFIMIICFLNYANTPGKSEIKQRMNMGEIPHAHCYVRCMVKNKIYFEAF